jgi:pimeloyl-ACP methyl ester carboxylesterase
MKNIKILFLFFAFIALNSNTFAQNRDLILLHGFGDDNRAWNVYTPFLRGTLSNTNTGRFVYPRGYEDSQGIGFAVDDIRNDIILPSNRSIAIGQSMGGIVARDLDRQNPNQNYGGLITLGSPNRGGVMLNALQAGTVQAELNEGCHELTQATGASLVAAAVNIPLGTGVLLTTLRVVFNSVGSTIVAFQNVICNEVMTRVNARIPTNGARQTVTDLSEGSELLRILNDANTPSFKIGVYGVEESPVHMRVLGSFMNPPHEQGLGVDNTDENLVATFHATKVVLDIIADVFGSIAIFQAINAIWNWPMLIPAAINAWASYECYDAVAWLNRSESRWHQVIGAGGFYTERRVMRWLTPPCQQELDAAFDLYEQQQLSWQQMALVRQTIMSNPSCFENVPYEVSLPINNQSDGFFNAGTQRIINDPLDQSHVVNIPAEKVNHREFYNHPKMTQIFQDIFRGDTPANDFFRIR